MNFVMILPLACSVILGAIYAFATEASGFSKLVVLLLVAGSAVVWFKYPAWWLAALLVEVLVSIGILLYLKVK